MRFLQQGEGKDAITYTKELKINIRRYLRLQLIFEVGWKMSTRDFMVIRNFRLPAVTLAIPIVLQDIDEIRGLTVFVSCAASVCLWLLFLDEILLSTIIG